MSTTQVGWRGTSADQRKAVCVKHLVGAALA